jgi:hypothetical protein
LGILTKAINQGTLKPIKSDRERTIRTWLCLKHHFYALTAHFGKWETVEGRKLAWVLLNDFGYSQVIKHQRRRKTVEVERRVLVGKANSYAERLRQAGLSGRINTSFVERRNLTVRQCVSKMTRRTWEPAKYTPELMEHLEWWRRHSNGERTIILSDRMKAWQKKWCSQGNAQVNSSPESTGSERQPCWPG